MTEIIFQYLGPIGGTFGVIALVLGRGWLQSWAKRIMDLEKKVAKQDDKIIGLDTKITQVLVDVSYMRGKMEGKNES